MSREIQRAGVQAARDARGVLAEAIAILDADTSRSAIGADLALALSQIVGALYRAELGGPEDVRDRLREAAAMLGGVLEAMHRPDGRTSLERAGHLVARSLAILHPARTELERQLKRAPQGPAGRAVVPATPTARGSDRRTSRRVEVEAEVGAHSRSHFLTGTSSDLSSGGLFIATEKPLPMGAEITVGLVLPDGHRILADAVVAWVRGPHAGVEGMGVRFIGVAPADAAAIARWTRSEG